MTLGGAPVTDRLRFARESARVELELRPPPRRLARRAGVALGGAAVEAGDRVVVEVECTTDEPRVGRRVGAVARDAGRVVGDDRRGEPSRAGAACGAGRATKRPWHRGAGARRHPAAALARRSGARARPPSRATRARASCSPRPRTSRPRAWTPSRASAATTTRCTAASSPRGSAACRGRSCTARGRRRARRRSSSTRSATATRARCGAGGSTSSRPSRSARRSTSRPRGSASTAGWRSSRSRCSPTARPSRAARRSSRRRRRCSSSPARASSTAASAPTAALARAPRARVWARADAAHPARGWASRCSTSSSATRPSCASPSGEVRRHPDGVLHRTEFTQPALLTLAAAQLAELREAGVLADACAPQATASASSRRCWRSACSSSSRRRARVPARRAHAALRPARRRRRSPFAFAVLDPSLAGGRCRLIEGVELISENALGRQCGRRRTARARSSELARRLPKGALRVHPGDRRAVSLVAAGARGRRAARRAGAARRRGRPPAARRALGAEPRRPAVLARAGLRRARRAASPATTTPMRSPGGSSSSCSPARSPRPCAGSTRSAPSLAPAPAGGLGARRIVELGPAGAPVLTGLMRTTLESLELAGPEPLLLHVEGDRDDGAAGGARRTVR